MKHFKQISTILMVALVAVAGKAINNSGSGNYE